MSKEEKYALSQTCPVSLLLKKERIEKRNY
jgi:hypothetical protein